MNTFSLNQLNWEKMDGLIPAIIQDANNGQVLMLGYMNQEALSITLKTSRVTFYSRSKQALWTKGKTSGNTLKLQKITHDCDQDCLLIQAHPTGPTCHKGTPSCFGEKQTAHWETLNQLEKIIAERAISKKENSYTNSLLKSGINKISQKVGEEAVESIIAALNEDDESLCNELADLFYHVIVLLKYRRIELSDVYKVLQKRMLGTCTQ